MRTAKTIALGALVALALILATVSGVAFAQALTVKLNKTSFVPGEKIIVTGTATPGADVVVGILNPNGDLVDMKIVTAGSNGQYTATFVIPSTIPTGNWIGFGTYTVKVTCGAHTVTTTFTLGTTAWITGTVVDEKGNPVAGATVTIKETGASVTTGSDGKFSLSAQPGTYTLVISKTGYKSTELTITVKTGENDVGTIKIVSLESALLALEKELASLKQNITDLANKYAGISTEISSALKDIAKKIDEVSSKIDNLASASTNVLNAVNSLSSKIDDVKSAVSSVSGAVSSVGSKVDNVASAINSLSSKVDNVNSAVGALSGKIDTVSGKVDSLSSKVGDLSSKVASLSSSMKSLSSSVSSALSDVKSTVSSLKGDISSLKSSISNLPSQVSSSVSKVTQDLVGKIGAATTAGWVAVIFAILAFIFALLSFLTVRKAIAK